MEDGKGEKVEPLVFLLKKNVEYLPVKEREKEDSKFYLTENSMSSSRMEIREANQSYPLAPNLPNRQTLYPKPKTEKYVK